MKQNSIVTFDGIPGVIFKVRVLKFDTFGPLSMFLGVSDAFCSLSNVSIVDQLLNFDKHLGVFGVRWRWWVPRWGHSPRMRSGGSGDEGSLPNSFGWEFILFIKTHFYGGALTSHFIEEHSSPTSIFPVFMMTSSNGNMFLVTGFCAGNSPVTAGTDQWSGVLIFTFWSAPEQTVE